ncbi:SHOCT domain-containing protein [Puniceibacterium sp. IMCC21224]|uniref:SHOCT domain-containing protein n=1 Tax=Puniceibacterium sp. IMCC21224 TaxID=1618204 RepID=UPI00064DDC0D|nr:SHOCT domain-containing protein [Puniceibacterium sp. IMCC21224]KMK66331.1 Short C-terminal domain [Puniceibacterium sp. IMCC21224]
MTRLTPEGTKLVADMAARHGVSTDAIETLLFAVANGHGTQAQFNHYELGGMGQWSLGGMTMIGDMFNNGLKARVDAMASELSHAIAGAQVFAPRPSMTSSQSQSQSGGTSLFVSGSGFGQPTWPEDLGMPSSTGAQNSMRYGVFPATRRLAIEIGGVLEVYDTGDHQISGVSQQQSGDQSLTFVSQNGLVRVADLPKVRRTETPATAVEPTSETLPTEPAPAAPQVAPAVQQDPEKVEPPQSVSTPPARPVPTDSADAIISLIQKLADLRTSGILTDTEFEAKKSELLSRL